MQFFVSQMDLQSNSYNDSYSDSYSYMDNNTPKEVDQEIPELVFLPDNPIIYKLLEVEKEESSKLIKQWNSDINWQDCVENMFRNTLEKQINKLLEYCLAREIMDQILVLKEDFKKNVCTQDLEER